MGNEHTAPPFVARTIHRFSVPIILAWLAIARHREYRRPLTGAGRERAFSIAESHRCAVVQGDEAHG